MSEELFRLTATDAVARLRRREISPLELVEIALISPPDGTVLYVLQGMRGTPGPITDVFRGVIPFMLVYILAIIVLMVAPELALWLPRVSQ